MQSKNPPSYLFSHPNCAEALDLSGCGYTLLGQANTCPTAKLIIAMDACSISLVVLFDLIRFDLIRLMARISGSQISHAEDRSDIRWKAEVISK